MAAALELRAAETRIRDLSEKMTAGDAQYIIKDDLLMMKSTALDNQTRSPVPHN